jgi:hypothetical protein
MSIKIKGDSEGFGNVTITSGVRLSASQSDLANAIREHFQVTSNGYQRWCRLSPFNGKPVFGFRFLSVHSTCRQQRFLLITEADGSQTTALLPQEL